MLGVRWWWRGGSICAGGPVPWGRVGLCSTMLVGTVVLVMFYVAAGGVCGVAGGFDGCCGGAAGGGGGGAGTPGVGGWG